MARGGPSPLGPAVREEGATVESTCPHMHVWQWIKVIRFFATRMFHVGLAVPHGTLSLEGPRLQRPGLHHLPLDRVAGVLDGGFDLFRPCGTGLAYGNQALRQVDVDHGTRDGP